MVLGQQPQRFSERRRLCAPAVPVALSILWEKFKVCFAMQETTSLD
jgi:hypothetical protein